VTSIEAGPAKAWCFCQWLMLGWVYG
jgi:hypothetical protein